MTPLALDPNNIIPLTLSHFLLERTLTMLPSPQVRLKDKAQICTLPRYKGILVLADHFATDIIRNKFQGFKNKSGGSCKNKDNFVLEKSSQPLASRSLPSIVSWPFRWLSTRRRHHHCFRGPEPSLQQNMPSPCYDFHGTRVSLNQ